MTARSLLGPSSDLKTDLKTDLKSSALKAITSDKDSVTSTDRQYDDAKFGHVWRKMDIFILPVVSMFYLLSYLDRTNFGNAKVAGLQRDLKLTNHQYSVALTVTYVPYIIAELPSNLILKAVGPNLMLPTMLSLWGLVTTFQGLIHSYQGLLVCRFFLGLMEGGVFPGLVLYLSFFYPRQKLQWRVTAFFSTATISGAFSGILAYGIIHMNGVGRRPGWAWIFILEGAFTFLFGIVSYFIIPRSPSHITFFTEEEKGYVIAKLKEDGTRDDVADSFSWREVGKAFTLPQVWFLAIVLFCDGTLVYALGYFAPSIVQELGFTAARAQLMSVPPFAAAFVVCMLLAYISDQYRCRGIISIVSSLLSLIGFGMFLGSHNRHIQYGSLFFSIAGAYSACATLSTWNANNAAPHTRRATTIAIGFIMTNAGGILATWLLGALSPTPPYRIATITLLAFSAVMAVFSLINLVYVWDQNRRKKLVRQWRSREEEKLGMGDKSAWFEYNL